MDSEGENLKQNDQREPIMIEQEDLPPDLEKLMDDHMGELTDPPNDSGSSPCSRHVWTDGCRVIDGGRGKEWRLQFCNNCGESRMKPGSEIHTENN